MASENPPKPIKPKRISLFLPNLGGGGAERVALAEARDLIQRGHDVDLVLICEGGELIPLLPPQVNIIEFRARRIIGGLWPLVRYLWRAKPDAIHAVMWPGTVIAVLAHRIARSRARVMVSDQVTLSQQVRSPRQLTALRWSTRLFYPRADIRVTCSIQAAEDLSRLARIPQNKIEVITNPIEPPDVIATTSEVEEMWRGASPKIVTIGSLKDQKNHALLLRAFAKLSELPDARLIIVGEGLLRPKLEALAGELGINDRVTMPGFFLDPWPFLASADLFVLSSDYEGFPLVLAEAMHAGLRVVSTNCASGPSELIDNGKYGRLVPCGDADALANAIRAELAEVPRPERQQRRARIMAGRTQIARYSELLTA